ncbi:hypothetical protein MMC14_006563 [Varicellaria rhodocarpa]|nr:hypothetical protein [Varicellaria rhodocarpa]
MQSNVNKPPQFTAAPTYSSGSSQHRIHTEPETLSSASVSASASASAGDGERSGYSERPTNLHHPEQRIGIGQQSWAGNLSHENGQLAEIGQWRFGLSWRRRKAASSSILQKGERGQVLVIYSFIMMAAMKVLDWAADVEVLCRKGKGKWGGFDPLTGAVGIDSPHLPTSFANLRHSISPSASSFHERNDK